MPSKSLPFLTNWTPKLKHSMGQQFKVVKNLEFKEYVLPKKFGSKKTCGQKNEVSKQIVCVKRIIGLK